MAKLDITVQLTGQDGNIFNLMGVVTKEMKKNGHRNKIDEFIKDVTSSKSYDEALVKIMEWVNVN